ncbi:MAG: hypothetical protein DRI69_02535 [Bacteroidetes bacterium]|nr:MAG: hypothetical protein DRI69_02535 [Bacteroidota bacterium]
MRSIGPNSQNSLVQQLICVVAFLFFASPAFSQKVSAFSLFESDSIVHIRMTTDMKLLVKKKYDEEYQPAIIEIFNPNGDTTSYDVKIKSRGNTRKKACNFPPIKIKFSKKNFLYPKLKLVITCSNNDPYDQILLKEYMAYQIFQKLSDKGFKTELLKIEYIDTGRDRKSFVRYGFVIETAESLADRMGGRVYNPKIMNTGVIDTGQLALFTMFQYMIANTDWAIQNLHNLEAVTDPVNKVVLVIPYDFDYSGFVDTHYAVVHESLPIESVTERYNKGVCINANACENYRRLFISKQEEILQSCRDFKYFNKGAKKETEGFLLGFFREIESEKNTKKIFCENCKPMK